MSKLTEVIVRYEAEGVGVGTFTWNGHTITNPFMDETGRWPVTPAHYGFEVTNTGGGCTAWVRDEGPGVELWVTDLNGDAATCDCRGWIIGLYYTGNDEMEPIWSVTVPVNCPPLTDAERIIDIADPDPRPQDDGTKRIVIDRGHEVLYVSLTSEVLYIDALPVEADDIVQIGAWTFAEMGSYDRPLEVTQAYADREGA
tara:strand:- start:1137 stop:1733 length:597 start_codon:yes stop_codon:yes gene_type:complete